jgi:hypothetical protein
MAWKRIFHFSHLPSPPHISCSWNLLNYSAIMSCAADSSSSHLLTFIVSWKKADFQKCEHLQRECWACSAPLICASRHSLLWTWTRTAWGPD